MQKWPILQMIYGLDLAFSICSNEPIRALYLHTQLVTTLHLVPFGHARLYCECLNNGSNKVFDVINYLNVTDMNGTRAVHGKAFSSSKQASKLTSVMWTGTLVLWLWVTTHVWKVMGSYPGAAYLMDIFRNKTKKTSVMSKKFFESFSF